MAVLDDFRAFVKKLLQDLDKILKEQNVNLSVSELIKVLD